ncbi:MAG: hypothetical protein IJJ23_12195 [Clostridia bacterium]|nr:hypothetical protein [Clostridia bacterium]
MADRIHVTTDWLNNCSNRLSAVEKAVGAAAQRLGAVELDEDSGAEVAFKMSATFAGQGYSARNVREAVNALRAAAGALQRDIQDLSAAARKNANDLADVQTNVDRMIDNLLHGRPINDGLQLDPNIFRRKGAPGVVPVLPPITPNGDPTCGYQYWREQQRKWKEWIESQFERQRKARERWEAWKEEIQKKKEQTDQANQARVYDESLIDESKYGSIQHGPLLDLRNDPDGTYHDMYRDIVYKNTGVRMSDSELEAYCSKMNREGCGYAAAVNVIFKAYEGRAAEFEKKFGFPMCDGNGQLNYNRLMCDFYSSTDNYNKNWQGKYTFDQYEDYKSGDDGKKADYDYYSDQSGHGETQKQQADRLEKYLNEHGVEYSAEQYGKDKVTPQNYQSYVDKGQQVVIFVGRPYYLRDMNGNVVRESDGGHFMTITGVNDKGQYIVSSWGGQYIVDPRDKHGFTYYNVYNVK